MPPPAYTGIDMSCTVFVCQLHSWFVLYSEPVHYTMCCVVNLSPITLSLLLCLILFLPFLNYCNNHIYLSHSLLCNYILVTLLPTGCRLVLSPFHICGVCGSNISSGHFLQTSCSWNTHGHWYNCSHCCGWFWWQARVVGMCFCGVFRRYLLLTLTLLSFLYMMFSSCFLLCCWSWKLFYNTVIDLRVVPANHTISIWLLIHIQNLIAYPELRCFSEVRGTS